MAVTPLPTPEPDDNSAVVIDLDSLTFGEMCELEDFFNKPSAELMREMRASTIRFLVYLVKRRADDRYTYEDTASLTMSQVRMGEDPPTSGSAA